MTSTEIIRPLADHAPKTYRLLNPRSLRKLATELLDLIGSDEQPRDALTLVAEYVVDEVRDAKEPIVGIRREDFALGILSKAGLATVDGQTVYSTSGLDYPVAIIEGERYVVDTTAKHSVTPHDIWPGW